MQYTEISSDQLRKKCRITIPAKQIESTFNQIIEDKIKNKTYPGFRPGKAPFSYVAKKEAGIIDSVIIDQAYKTWDQIKKDKKIVIFDQSEEIKEIDIDAYKKNSSDVDMIIEFEVFPDVPEIKFEEISVKSKTFEVKEEDILAHIEKIKSETYIFDDTQKDYLAKKNDLVTIDCQGTINQKEFKGGNLKDFSVQIGTHKILDDIENAIIGMKISEEKVVDTVFPDNYHDFSLSGKKATFRIVVKKIQEAKRPKTQEDLMKKFGYKEKDAFLDEIKKVVEQSCNAKIKADIRSQIEDQLQDYEFMVPSSLLERQKQIIKKANQNKDEINTEDEALKTARLSLIFARFATLKNLKLDKQDVIDHLKKTSSIIGVPENYLFQTYQNSKDFAGSLNVRLMEEKIVSALCDTVKKQDIPSSVAEILKEKDENQKDLSISQKEDKKE